MESDENDHTQVNISTSERSEMDENVDDNAAEAAAVAGRDATGMNRFIYFNYMATMIPSLKRLVS